VGRKTQRQGPEAFPSNTSGTEPPPPSGTAKQNNHLQTNMGSNRAATGPRTELGKSRSSKNAVKFGILSKATLLKGESRAEYNSLLVGLWETYQPVGKLEEILVDKLASVLWRIRRLLIAECAEIRKMSDFREINN
jgi:hypothetical protein